MKKRMNWKHLLCDERFNDKSKNKDNPDPRSEFLRDTDRIIFSSPFRRMQDKTQVFPIPKSDFVHNRLTHSLEVASVGRSLGLLAGKFVIDKEKLKDIESRDFGNIIYAACLAHDIGNPPFGHSGEKAISSYFETFEAKSIEDKLKDFQFSDFKIFEGNALGFRILTNNFPNDNNGGLKLTYATLGAFTKYPWNSLASVDKEEGKVVPDNVVEGKFGFFKNEEVLFTEVANKLQLIKKESSDKYNVWCRHPLAYLVEAADTICYRIIDIEDIHKLKLISTKEAENLLIPIWKESVENNFDENRLKLIKDDGERIGFLRAKAINALIHSTFKVFEDKYPSIMEGNYMGELIKESSLFPLVKKIKEETSRLGFNNKTVLKLELAGFEILSGLVAKFIEAYSNPDKLASEKLMKLIPSQFKDIKGGWKKSDYEQILMICDYVARMTDSYALDLHSNIKGISIPNI